MQAETRTEEILGLMLSELRSQGRQSKKLWTIDDIAQELSMSRQNLYKGIINHPSFPRPFVLPTGGKRYKASEVMAWIEKHR